MAKSESAPSVLENLRTASGLIRDDMMDRLTNFWEGLVTLTKVVLGAAAIVSLVVMFFSGAPILAAGLALGWVIARYVNDMYIEARHINNRYNYDDNWD